jgi:hypothetical protein
MQAIASPAVSVGGDRRAELHESGGLKERVVLVFNGRAVAGERPWPRSAAPLAAERDILEKEIATVHEQSKTRIAGFKPKTPPVRIAPVGRHRDSPRGHHRHRDTSDTGHGDTEGFPKAPYLAR